MSVYSIYPATFGASTINQVGSIRPSPGLQKLMARAGGALTRSLIGTAQADPKIALTTFDLATVLGIVSPLTGLAVSAASKLQYQKRADQSTFAGALSHIVVNFTKALVVPTTLRAAQDDARPAAMDLEATVLFDGTNTPLTFSTGQSLTGTPAVNEVYYLGPVFIEGSQVTQVQSVEIVPGLTVRSVRGDGIQWPKEASIVAIDQSIRILVKSLEEITALGLFGSGHTSGAVCYLRKGVHGGARKSNATAEHISFTTATCFYEIEELPVEQEGDAEARIMITPTGNLSFSTTATIPGSA